MLLIKVNKLPGTWYAGVEKGKEREGVLTSKHSKGRLVVRGARLVKAVEIATDDDGPAGQGIAAFAKSEYLGVINFGEGLPKSGADLTDENHRSAAETVGIGNGIGSRQIILA